MKLRQGANCHLSMYLSQVPRESALAHARIARRTYRHRPRHRWLFAYRCRVLAIGRCTHLRSPSGGADFEPTRKAHVPRRDPVFFLRITDIPTAGPYPYMRSVPWRIIPFELSHKSIRPKQLFGIRFRYRSSSNSDGPICQRRKGVGSGALHIRCMRIADHAVPESEVPLCCHRRPDRPAISRRMALSPSDVVRVIGVSSFLTSMLDISR